MSRLSLEEKIQQITPDASLGGVNPSLKKHVSITILG